MQGGTMIFKNKEQKLEKVNDGISRRILAHDKNLMLVELYFEKGAMGTPHSHIHEQVSYVKEGKFEYESNGVTLVLEAGDSIFLPSNSVHGAVCIEKGVLLDIFTPQREDFLKKE